MTPSHAKSVTMVLLALVGTACRAQEEPVAPELAPYAAVVEISGVVINTVSPLIFGDNIEWTNDGMGIWLRHQGGPDSGIVDLIREAGVTHLRYPGGTLSDYFDWYKAVGADRDPVPNPFAEPKGRLDEPVFGPEEFAALCRELGIPATITLNAGTGTAEDAAGWVRWCIENGLDVTAYAVGNEIYMVEAMGEPIPELPISKTPEEYAELYLQFHDAIEAVAPGTELGAIGLHSTTEVSLNTHADWMEVVLGRCGHVMDFIDIHCGYAPVVRGGFDPRVEYGEDDHFALAFMGASEFVRQNIELTKADIAAYAPDGGADIGIHITEYGPLVYPIDPARAVDDVQWNRSLAGALYLASLFNMLLAEPRVTSANHLPLCQDVFGALVGFRYPQRTTWRNVVFHVFRAYSELSGRQVLAVNVQAPAYSTQTAGFIPPLVNIPYVDAGAYASEDGRLRVCLVNRSVNRTAGVTIALPRAMRVAEVSLLTADTYRAENSPEAPEAVTFAVAEPPTGNADRFVVNVPRHTLAVVDLEEAGGE